MVLITKVIFSNSFLLDVTSGVGVVKSVDDESLEIVVVSPSTVEESLEDELVVLASMLLDVKAEKKFD